MKDILKKIKICLPKNSFTEQKEFIDIFDDVNLSKERLMLRTQPDNVFPKIELNFENDGNSAYALFEFDNSSPIRINIANQTGAKWESHYRYKKLSLSDFESRIKENSIKISHCDHVGFNLPWKGGIHPEIQNIIQKIRKYTLLHKFPKNDNWYFIIPGTVDEIDETTDVNYGLDRSPKFEIVNFETASTPLIQFDVSINTKYEIFQQLFPEAIMDDERKNLWVYIDNNSDVDLCFVLNEPGKGWTNFFNGYRI